MIKHLYKIFADKWHKGGRIFFYSDPHFSDLECYKLRFPDVFEKNAMGRILYENLVGKEKAARWDEDCVEQLDKYQVECINKTISKNDTLIILGDVGNVECVSKIRAGRKILLLGNHDKGISNYFRHRDETGDNHLFDEVYEGPLFISERIILSHEPIEFPFALNIHGHVHSKDYKSKGINCCAEVIGYTPICLNDIIKSGRMKDIKDIHRQTIDKAIDKKKKKK